MCSPKILYFGISVFLILTSCTTAHHGSFVPSTYSGNYNGPNSMQIGRVMGQSCQIMVLYVFPLGPAPSTDEAIQSAKGQNEGTKYLTDISIDDRTEWKIGYSRQCITVEGIAH